MSKFIIKHVDNRKPQINNHIHNKTASKKEDNDKKKINEEVMTTSEKVAMAQEVLSSAQGTQVQAFKRVKKDKGLIERTESSKTILTEDNKELLND